MMETQEVIIRFPVIRAQLAGNVVGTQNWKGRVSSTADINKQIENELDGMLKAINHHLKSGITVNVVTEGGKIVHVPFSASLTWDIQAHADDQAFDKRGRKPLQVRFGSKRHRILWRLGRTEDWTSLNNKDGAILEAAGYISGFQVTERGKQLLEKLNQEGPRTKGEQVKLARFLIDCITPGGRVYSRNPMMGYAIPSGLVTRDVQPVSQLPTLNRVFYNLTPQGREWLEERSVWLMHERNIDTSQTSYIRRIHLIGFLPLEALNEFLVSEQHFYRKAARERYAELTGSEWKEEPI